MVAVPPGFRRERGAGTFLITRPRFLEAARTAGTLGRGGLVRVFETAQGGEAGRGTTGIFSCGGATPDIVGRRLLHGGWLGRWLGDRFLSAKRPIGELAITAELRELGVSVPEPVGVAGERRFGFWRLAIATVLEEDAVDALRWLEAGPSQAEVLRVAAATGRTVRRFHDAGGYHADLHIKNLMVRQTGDRYEAIVIDLDGARRVRGMTPEERMSQLMRIFRSLVKRDLVETVGMRGCARFLGAYCAGDLALRRSMWRRLDTELRRIAIHRIGYRAPSRREP